MSRLTAGSALSIALALASAGCGGENDGVTTPEVTLPNVAGSYSGSWTLQVLRKSDGFQKQFRCYGQFTIQQSTTSGPKGVLSGWAAVGTPCTSDSYDLNGAVTAGGVVGFTTDGPAPTEGPCPGGKAVHFSGQGTSTSTGSYKISARAVTNVTCPQYGEHEFTYILEGYRY